MSSRFGFEEEDTYIIQDRTMAVEVPIELALEVHAFLANNERKNSQCEIEPDPRYYHPIQVQPSTLQEKFSQRISECYRFERHNNEVLKKKLEAECVGHEGTKMMLKTLSEKPRAARES